MKTLLLFFVAAVLAGVASATDIALADGRALKDATIMSQTPRTVIVKHTGGLCSVAKELLPPELAARYPVDETAVGEADERAARALESLRAAEQGETERRAKYYTPSEDAGTERSAAEKTTAAAVERRNLERQAAEQEFKARRLVERYFEERYRAGSETTSCSATITEFRPLNGRSGPWFVAGSASVVITYWSTPMDDSIPQLVGDGVRQPDTVVMRDFEAIFTADGPEPTVSVTLR